MLPPILPSPTSPISIPKAPKDSALQASVLQTYGHDQVAEGGVRVCADLLYTRDRSRFGVLGDRQVPARIRHDREALEQVVRIEADRDVCTVNRGFERLGRLGLFAAAGFEEQLSVGEAQS